MTSVPSDERNYVLLTGACGFVGRYLLRDLSASGVQVAVAVRSRGRHSALERVQRVIAFCEKSLGKLLPMPRVIRWDLQDDVEYGMAREDHDWIFKNVRSILHSAASVRFTLDAEAREPFESNVEGTRRLIELATQIGPVDFHHISTAYVCGDWSGVAFENERRQPIFKNVYEESKHLAEIQLRDAAPSFKSLTIYRPSIVVGDSATGYASTFQTIYGGLRLASTMPESHRNDVKSLFDWLGVSGESTKNLVPVDWLSQAVIKIFNRPQLHNQTYHLTHPHTVSVVELAAAMVSAIQKEADIWQAMKYSASETIAVDDIKRVFLDSFQNYFANDPAFDHRNVTNALPNFETPRLTHDCLERMFRYAIRQRFMDAEHAIPSGSTPASLPSVATSNQVAKPVFPHAWSLTVVDRSGPCETDGDQPYASATDNLRVMSHIVFDSHSSGSDVNGSHQHPQIFVRRPVLPLIESGAMTIEHALRSGCLVAFGTADSKNVALEQLRTCLAHPFGKTLLADRIFSNPCRDVNLSLCGQVGER